MRRDTPFEKRYRRKMKEIETFNEHLLTIVRYQNSAKMLVDLVEFSLS